MGALRRIDPDDARRGENDFKAVAQKLAAEFGKAADQMNAVAALGHVRLGAALKVAVAEARKFFQECQAQTDFQTPSEAQQAGGDGDFKQEEGGRETRAVTAKRLRPKSINPRNRIASTDHGGAGKRESDGDGGWSEDAVGAQQSQQLDAGARGGLFEHG